MLAQEQNEQKVTIEELAQKIEENNIQLQLASNNILVADANIGEVKNNRLPDINLNAQAFYLSDVQLFDTSLTSLENIDIPNFGNQLNLNVTQLLYAGGRVNKAIDLAELNKFFTENQYLDVEQTIKLAAAELYINLYNLRNQKTILVNNRDLATERTKTAQYFYNENMITKSELLRAQVLERGIEQSILQVSNAISITNKNLTLLAGMDEEVSIIPDVENLKLQNETHDELYFRAMAFDNNPLLLASENQIAIAEKSLEITRADRLPTLAGFAGYNANRPQTSPPLDLFINTYQIGLSLSYDLETVYKNRRKEEVDKRLIDQSILAKEAVRQEIEAQVNAAYKNYYQAIEQLEVSTLNEIAAAENYRITALKYKNQLVTYIEIVDAANLKLQAELQLLNDKTNIVLNYVKLLRSTGQL